MDTNHLMFVVAAMLLASAMAVVIAKKLNLGSIVGLLIVGIVLGPHSPKPLLTGHVAELRAVGEIGVMLLVFVVALEIKPASLWSMRRLVFGLGTAQYVLTTLAMVAFFAAVFGPTQVQWLSVLVVSLALAMSSGAIPLPIIEERHDAASPHGQAVIAIDILQGFMLIPVLSLIPILGGAAGDTPTLDVTKTLEVIGSVVGVYLMARFLLPWALGLTARTLGPGGFSAIVIAGVFFAGWWMDSVGVSMALGAFMIGVLLSTTVYAEQIKASVTPAKQLLLGLFFIAIGMAIDFGQVAQHKAELLFYIPTLLFIKFAVLFVLARLFRFNLRSSILTGLLMMPFDEIAYVILASANANGLLDSKYYAVGLIMISFSFVVSPILVNLGYKFTDRLQQRRPEHAKEGALPPLTGSEVIVSSCGPVGRAMCMMLERASLPYIAFDTDQEHLSMAASLKQHARYGDLSDPRLMSAIGLGSARLVLLTGTPASSRGVLGNLRQYYPNVPAMTAVQYLAQRDDLLGLGASDVFSLSTEGALGFGRSALERLGVARTTIDEIATALRADDYAALRQRKGDRESSHPGADRVAIPEAGVSVRGGR